MMGTVPQEENTNGVLCFKVSSFSKGGNLGGVREGFSRILISFLGVLLQGCGHHQLIRVRAGGPQSPQLFLCCPPVLPLFWAGTEIQMRPTCYL